MANDIVNVKQQTCDLVELLNTSWNQSGAFQFPLSALSSHTQSTVQLDDMEEPRRSKHGSQGPVQTGPLWENLWRTADGLGVC